MISEETPQLRTPGRIAEEVGQPLHRVQHILRTRGHIKPVARAGVLRLYDQSAVCLVRDELERADLRRHRGATDAN